MSEPPPRSGTPPSPSTNAEVAAKTPSGAPSGGSDRPPDRKESDSLFQPGNLRRRSTVIGLAPAPHLAPRKEQPQQTVSRNTAPLPPTHFGAGQASSGGNARPEEIEERLPPPAFGQRTMLMQPPTPQIPLTLPDQAGGGGPRKSSSADALPAVDASWDEVAAEVVPPKPRGNASAAESSPTILIEPPIARVNTRPQPGSDVVRGFGGRVTPRGLQPVDHVGPRPSRAGSDPPANSVGAKTMAMKVAPPVRQQPYQQQQPPPQAQQQQQQQPPQQYMQPVNPNMGRIEPQRILPIEQPPNTERMMRAAQPQYGGIEPKNPSAPMTAALAVRGWEPPNQRHALTGKLDKRLVLMNDPDSARAAGFRALRDSLLGKSLPRVLAVASATPNEGKTTCAVNLALALAEQSNTNVLLVDANWFSPELADIFHVDRLASVAPPDPALGQYKICAVSASLHVAAITKDASGKIPRFEQAKFEALIDRLCRANYDYIIIDTPALRGTPNAATLVSNADGTILAVRAGNVTARDLRKVMDMIPSKKALGIALIDGVN